jgi:hypothetical protein
VNFVRNLLFGSKEKAKPTVVVEYEKSCVCFVFKKERKLMQKKTNENIYKKLFESLW